MQICCCFYHINSHNIKSVVTGQAPVILERKNIPGDKKKKPKAKPKVVHVYIKKIKIHSSCEIEDFVDTHLCKLCVIL